MCFSFFPIFRLNYNNNMFSFLQTQWLVAGVGFGSLALTHTHNDVAILAQVANITQHFFLLSIVFCDVVEGVRR